MECTHCESENTNKAGFTHNGKQRLYCRSCRRFSRENSAPLTKSTNKKSKYKTLPSKNHLILKLQALSQKLGKTPTTADVTAFAKTRKGFPLDVYYEVFGSFTEALKQSKLQPVYKQEFDKEKLIAELKVLRKKQKRALIAKDLREAKSRGEVSSLYHFERAFGSVPAAITVAGSGRKAFTKTELKKYMAKLRNTINREPTGKDIAERFVPGETPSLKDILRAFKTLTKARSS